MDVVNRDVRFAPARDWRMTLAGITGSISYTKSEKTLGWRDFLSGCYFLQPYTF
jgi:hypothetical protein